VLLQHSESSAGKTSFVNIGCISVVYACNECYFSGHLFPLFSGINQSNNILGGLISGTTARSIGDSQLMSSKWSGKDFLNRCVLRRRRNVVSDSADVTSSVTGMHAIAWP